MHAAEHLKLVGPADNRRAVAARTAMSPLGPEHGEGLEGTVSAAIQVVPLHIFKLLLDLHSEIKVIDVGLIQVSGISGTPK